MAYTKQIFEPYKVIDGVEYYKVGTVAEIVGKSRQTIQLWDTYSDELDQEGKIRLIPKSTRLGGNGIRCWTSLEIDEIIEFSNNVKYGDLSTFNRARWGIRGENVVQDRSTEARKQRQEYRNNVDKRAKKLQKQQKVQEIKQARQNMLKAVRKHAKQVYGTITYENKI